MKSSLKDLLYTLIGIVILLLGWITISSCVANSNMIFPNPLITIKEVGKLLTQKYTYVCIWKSFLRTIIGFAIAFILAIILGIFAGNFPAVKKIFSPFFSVLKSIPTASLVFLFLVFVGSKNAPILMVLLISLPIIYEAIVRGFENIHSDVIDASSIDGASFSKKVCKIYIPIITPYIFVGVVSSFSLSFKIEIMAEVISGSTTEGLGSVISACQKSDPSNMVPIFAYSFIAVVVVAILSVLLYFLEKKIGKPE